MPLTPEEPQIHENTPGPRVAAGTARAPQASRSSTVPLPGPRAVPRPAPPRPAAPRPAQPRADRNRPGHGRTGPGGRGPAAARGPQAGPVSTARVELTEATEATAVETADTVVDALLDAGRAPGDVLVLTTGELHPWAQHELSFGERAYWRQLTQSDDVFCAHTASATRIGRRPVVVLAVNGGTEAEVAQALPVALDKAGEQLVVCGDPKTLNGLV